MALSRIHVWSPGDILTASDLNNEFNNSLTNPIALFSPTTGAINFALLAHTNLLPSVITASSASAGQALIASGGATVWGAPTITYSTLSSGQLLIGTSSGGAKSLNIGTTGQILAVTSSNSDPAWQVIPPSGGLTTGALSTGSLFYYSTAGTVLPLAIGTSGMPLVAGTSGLPAYVGNISATALSSGTISTGALFYVSTGGLILPLALGSTYFSLSVTSSSPFVGWVAPSGVEPETYAVTYDDFITGDFFADSFSAYHRWGNSTAGTYTLSTVSGALGNNGIVAISDTGIGTSLPSIWTMNSPTTLGTAVPANFYTVDKNPLIKVRWANQTTGLGIRFIGLNDSTSRTLFSTGDPANGIYFRTTGPGATINGVCRSGGVESAVSMGVISTDQTFHTHRAVISSSQVDFYTNGALSTTVTTNIPTVFMLFGAGIQTPAANSGLYVDYIYVRQAR